MLKKDYISEETVNKTAELAKLKLTPIETATAQKAIAGLLHHAAILSDLPSLPSAREDFSAQAREDVATDSFPPEKILSNAPFHDNEYFIVPKTVE